MYGAAEFSRDTDLVVLASPDSLDLLRAALRELLARRIAVPPFEIQYLLSANGEGLFCRFRLTADRWLPLLTSDS